MVKRIFETPQSHAFPMIVLNVSQDTSVRRGVGSVGGFEEG